MSHVIESSHRNYSGDFQKAEFLENSKVHIFISLYYKIPAQNEKLAQVHVSSFCPSYSGVYGVFDFKLNFGKVIPLAPTPPSPPSPTPHSPPNLPNAPTPPSPPSLPSSPRLPSLPRSLSLHSPLVFLVILVPLVHLLPLVCLVPVGSTTLRTPRNPPYFS